MLQLFNAIVLFCSKVVKRGEKDENESNCRACALAITLETKKCQILLALLNLRPAGGDPGVACQKKLF